MYSVFMHRLKNRFLSGMRGGMKHSSLAKKKVLFRKIIQKKCCPVMFNIKCAFLALELTKNVRFNKIILTYNFQQLKK